MTFSGKQAILVTGVGGVVGQGILRSLRGMSDTFTLVGTNTLAVSGGNHLCDAVYEVPYAQDELYISAIKQILKKENIQLVIPSTDHEAVQLSKHSDQIPVAVSPYEVVDFCNDKYRNYQVFNEGGIRFASSCLPRQYKGQFADIVVKPRDGRGSRDVHVNPEQVSNFDDTYVVQEYLRGPEITCAFYVTQSGVLHGFIALRRELEHGNTIRCEVVNEYDEELRNIFLQIIKLYPFRGSCNLQAKITDDGIIPFEINCRISGTNSIRSQFGFEDVRYTVQEYLWGMQPDPPRIRQGVALRVVRDVIYHDRKMSEIGNASDGFYIY